MDIKKVTQRSRQEGTMSAHTPRLTLQPIHVDAPCGCTVRGNDFILFFCPLHAAAPRMLDVLKLIMSHWVVECRDQEHFICKAQNEARDILRDVEGT